MKTSLFYAIATKPDLARQLFADLAILFDSPTELRNACLDALPKLARVMTQRQRRAIAERVADAHDTGIGDVTSVMQPLHFLMRQLSDEDYSKDTVEDMLSDLEDCGASHGLEITETHKEIFREIVRNIQSSVPQYKDYKSQKATAAGVLPSLRGFGSTVELRAVVGNEFRIGMLADGYAPDVKGLVPVVSVSIEVDSGVVDEFSFQASPEELEALIEELKSALVCLQHVKKLVAVSDSATVPEREMNEERD